MHVPFIREYQPHDAAGLRRCVVALQDYERALDSNLPAGEQMADAYVERLQVRCLEAQGRVFVADGDGEVLGFVGVVAREPFTEPDDPAGSYALITDLIVLAAHRGRGIGRQLLARAETFARDEGARELRIGLLTQNVAARRLYLDTGFTPLLEVLAKRW